MEKIKIAFVKFGGLSAGGTERWLQMMAVHLNKSKFEVDFYYCDTAPYVGADFTHPGTDTGRKQYMENNGINLIEFTVGAKDITKPTHDWVDTNFWEVFDENKYDIIQTAKAGPKEYPYFMMKKPVVEYITLLAGVDNSVNISRSIHLSHWQRDGWVKAGGDKKISSVIPIPAQEPSSSENLRKELNIPDNAVVAGFHQRPENTIYSEIPLDAFSKIIESNYYFVIMGGGDLYKKQAKDLGLKNVRFVEPQSDPVVISKFLNTLDIFAHGRKDGETFGTVFAEAMMHHLPCIAHRSDIANGHKETIGLGGIFAENKDDYQKGLLSLFVSSEKRNDFAKKGFEYAEKMYLVEACVRALEVIYEDVIKSPFPFLHKRILRNWIIDTKHKLSLLIKQRIGARVYDALSLFSEGKRTSYENHNSSYSEDEAFEREKAVYERYDSFDYLSQPSISLIQLLAAHPEVNNALIDIGSGNGWLSVRKSDYFKHIYAIEPSKKVIEIAKRLSPIDVQKNITWIDGYAEEELGKISLAEPAVFVTLTVLSHLPDKVVERICKAINLIAPKGSLICFAECWGKQYKRKLWHVRTKEWWQKNLSGWQIDFNGSGIEGVDGRFKGFHAVKSK